MKLRYGEKVCKISDLSTGRCNQVHEIMCAVYDSSCRQKAFFVDCFQAFNLLLAVCITSIRHRQDKSLLLSLYLVLCGQHGKKS
ncbi:CLUMA_CG013948, isoform A [Clunio marinus]|uniref:CLUMA_CG013948, isoform A n=1 Tax=Clunio marinus TaxID=568069 RepID=A0A1J1IQA9_9DIPT|nr:CLUMA_CG013948, isoform A [Clunio marinus]